MRINPFFEIDGKKYEIKRTRYLETEYEKLSEKENFTDEQQKQIANFLKLQTEQQEIAERLINAREAYYDDICNDEKEKVYNKFQQLYDAKYNEILDYELKHKDTSFSELQKLSLSNGEKILFLGLAEQYKISYDEAKSIWEHYVDIIGVSTASEWIVSMLEALFSAEEEDPFLAQARAKAQQKAEQRKGLSKIRK